MRNPLKNKIAISFSLFADQLYVYCNQKQQKFIFDQQKFIWLHIFLSFRTCPSRRRTRPDYYL